MRYDTNRWSSVPQWWCIFRAEPQTNVSENENAAHSKVISKTVPSIFDPVSKSAYRTQNTLCVIFEDFLAENSRVLLLERTFELE